MIKDMVIDWLGKIPYSSYLANKYIVSFFILLGAVAGAFVLLFIFERYLGKIAAKTKTGIDDLIFSKVKKPLFYLIVVYGLKLSFQHLEIDGIITKIIGSLMALVFIFVLIRAVNIIIDVWGKAFARKTKSKVDDVVLPLFHKGVKVVLHKD